MDDVFIGSEAVAGGVLTRGQLRWNFRALFPDVYVPRESTLSLRQRAVGAWLWSGRRAVVAGLTASALHGARWVDDSSDVELIWRHPRPPRGIVARNERIEADEIIQISGLPVTTPERTALDLARHHARDVAVTRLDALSSASGITTSDVQALVDRYRGARHWIRAVDALHLMDGGSGSPYKTTVRLALVDAGLPAPGTQITATDGKATAVIAMGYEGPKVAIDFGPAATEFVALEEWAIIRACHAYNTDAIAYLVRAAVIEAGYSVWTLRRLSRG